jgi:hypothetical protein
VTETLISSLGAGEALSIDFMWDQTEQKLYIMKGRDLPSSGVVSVTDAAFLATTCGLVAKIFNTTTDPNKSILLSGVEVQWI